MKPNRIQFLFLLASALTLVSLSGCGKGPGAASVPEGVQPQTPSEIALGGPSEKEMNGYMEMLEKSRLAQQDIHNLASLRQGVRRFQGDYGRTPTNLVELVKAEYLSALPPAPEGQRYDYDPKHGNVKPVSLNPRRRLNDKAFQSPLSAPKER